MQMNVSMLFMSYSYCSLPVLVWLVDRELGRLAHTMPRCKNTVNQDLSVSVFKGEQVSCRGCKWQAPIPLGDRACLSVGKFVVLCWPRRKTAGRVQRGPKQRKPPWFTCAAGPEDGKSSKRGCSMTGVEAVWHIFPSSSPRDCRGRGTGGIAFLPLSTSASWDLYPLVQ